MESWKLMFTGEEVQMMNNLSCTWNNREGFLLVGPNVSAALLDFSFSVGEEGYTPNTSNFWQIYIWGNQLASKPCLLDTRRF